MNPPLAALASAWCRPGRPRSPRSQGAPPPTRSPRWRRPLIAGGLSAASVLAALAAMPGTGRASLAEALSLEELVAEAELVVVGDCVEKAARFDDRDRIVTDVDVRVMDQAKGETPRGRLVTVRTFGGVVGDLGMRMTGAAQLPMRSRQVLFLTREGPGGRRRVVGMSQGALPVARTAAGEDVVRPGGAGLSLVRPGPTGALVPATPALAGPTPLPIFLDAVRDLVAAQGAVGR